MQRNIMYFEKRSMAYRFLLHILYELSSTSLSKELIKEVYFWKKKKEEEKNTNLTDAELCRVGGT